MVEADNYTALTVREHYRDFSAYLQQFQGDEVKSKLAAGFSTFAQVFRRYSRQDFLRFTFASVGLYF
jgi:hypothetical protein